MKVAIFLSTLPARGATHLPPAMPTTEGFISIHAPREGSDAGPCSGPAHPAHFYPRSPRGERLGASLLLVFTFIQFLSTLPARGATVFFW